MLRGVMLRVYAMRCAPLVDDDGGAPLFHYAITDAAFAATYDAAACRYAALPLPPCHFDAMAALRHKRDEATTPYYAIFRHAATSLRYVVATRCCLFICCARYYGYITRDTARLKRLPRRCCHAAIITPGGYALMLPRALPPPPLCRC